MNSRLLFLQYSLIFMIAAQIFVTADPQLPAKNFGKQLLDHIDAGVNIGNAVAKKIPTLIPTPEEILEFGKQSIAGLPFQIAASAISNLCSLALITNGTKSQYTPNITEISYVLITDSDNVSIPVIEPVKLWTNNLFDPKLRVVVMVTGWTTDLNETIDSASAICNAYKNRGDSNFILLDSARYVDTLYTWSAFNTKQLGDYLGEALAELINYVPLNKIHVIGHSLGAQISGAAGQKFQEITNMSLPRITGLDPANPCFFEGESLNGLNRGDADFIDIIHSNIGVLGKRDPIGDADFYPNGLVPLQPGCLSVTCSHARAWEYYAESVYKEQENNFLATRCNSLSSVENGACKSKPVPMGHSVPLDIKGNYFLKTYSKSPFGMNTTKSNDFSE